MAPGPDTGRYVSFDRFSIALILFDPSLNKLTRHPHTDDREFHGCPYKHFDEANLNKLLERSGVSVGDRDEMLRLSRGQVGKWQCECM